MPLDRAGRVIVGPDLTIPGHPEVFVAGDMAAATSADTGQPVPGVAQGGIQMGRYAGRTIAREVAAVRSARDADAVRLPRQGVAGRHRQGEGRRADRPAAACGGFVAWLLWGGVHIAFLIGFRNRLAGAAQLVLELAPERARRRLITGEARLDLQVPRAIGFDSDRTPSSPTKSNAA